MPQIGHLCCRWSGERRGEGGPVWMADALCGLFTFGQATAKRPPPDRTAACSSPCPLGAFLPHGWASTFDVPWLERAG